VYYTLCMFKNMQYLVSNNSPFWHKPC